MQQRAEWILRRKYINGVEIFYPICHLSKQEATALGKGYFTREEKEYLGTKRIKFKVTFTDGEFRKIAKEWVKYD